jgi:hypothetical protein
MAVKEFCFGILIMYCPPGKPPAKPDPQVIVCNAVEPAPKLTGKEYDAMPEKVLKYINRHDSKRRKNNCK